MGVEKDDRRITVVRAIWIMCCCTVISWSRTWSLMEGERSYHVGGWADLDAVEVDLGLE